MVDDGKAEKIDRGQYVRGSKGLHRMEVTGRFTIALVAWIL
jgi:hypothetical protein